MPTYEYSCPSCHQISEVVQSMRDPVLTQCPKCGKEGVKRLIGRGAGIIFKGSGFYETDYKRQPEKKTDSAAAPASSAPAAATAPSTAGSSSASTSTAAPASTPASSTSSPAKSSPSSAPAKSN
jgi:putative FmdB family regulatory protein